MDKMRFTSRLTTDDIHRFLMKYGGFLDCFIHDNIQKTPSELILYFSNHGLEYKIWCEDFGMRITQTQENSTPEIRPSADDWFCFLKSKFGRDYSMHYAQLFHAEDIILNKPQYISQISFNEFSIVIKNILGYQKKWDTSTLSIVEVESFFQSERRFYISGAQLEKPFYMRISDFQVISPRFLSYKFRLVMEKMFGEEYMQSYQKNFKKILHDSINIKEFNPHVNKQKISATN